MTDKLKEKVNHFRTMSLPGQPLMMHMGTSHLVDELWMEVLRLREIVKTGDRIFKPQPPGDKDESLEA